MRLINNKIVRLPLLDKYNTMFIKLKNLIYISEYEIKQHVVSYGNRISYAVVSTPLNDIFSLGVFFVFVDCWNSYEVGRLRRAITIIFYCHDLFTLRRAGFKRN